MGSRVVSVDDLRELAGLGIEYGETFIRERNDQTDFELFAIFLYGSAARCYLGLAMDHGDWDIGVVYRMLRPNEDRLHISTRNRPLDLTTFRGKTVQVTRNVYSGSLLEPEAGLRELTKMNSPRWKSIRTHAVILLHLEIKTIWRSPLESS